MSDDVDRSDLATDESAGHERQSLVPVYLICVATTTMLIAPSIPNSWLAVAAFATFLFATMLTKMHTLRQLFFVALDRSATLQFSDREPYGDAWDLL